MSVKVTGASAFSLLAFAFPLLQALAKTCEVPKGWHLDRLDQEQGLDSCYRPNVSPRIKPVLYVIDSGVYGGHSEFESGSGSSVADGYNFQEHSWDSGDCSGHGSHVAAIAAGKRFGVAGSIPVDIVSVRILDCEGRGSCSAMLKAMDWVHQNRMLSLFFIERHLLSHFVVLVEDIPF